MTISFNPAWHPVNLVPRYPGVSQLIPKSAEWITRSLGKKVRLTKLLPTYRDCLPIGTILILDMIDTGMTGSNAICYLHPEDELFNIEFDFLEPVMDEYE